MPVEHIGFFKFALLELFIGTLRLNLEKPLKARKPNQELQYL